MPNWQEALWYNQNLLEGLYIPFGLGASWDPAGELESIVGDVQKLILDKQKVMDGWKNILF